MTAFHDVLFPTAIALGASGGPERRTQIVTLASGREERNQQWTHSRRRYDAGYGVKSLDDIYAVIAFFARHPTAANLFMAVFLIAGTVLTFTRYGRLVKAIGSNIEAVRLSGIPVAGYIMSVYVISGILAAAAGIISASRTGVGSANIGVGAELDAIAAVVIGGASLMGGRGGAFNTFIGVIVLGIIANMMNLARVPGYHQQVFMGCIIIGAMLLQYASNWLRR